MSPRENVGHKNKVKWKRKDAFQVLGEEELANGSEKEYIHYGNKEKRVLSVKREEGWMRVK